MAKPHEIADDHEMSAEAELDEYLMEPRRGLEHLVGRYPVEELPENHIYSWLVRWMNIQLADVGVTAWGSEELPNLHFDLVRVKKGQSAAHALPIGSTRFIIVSEPMIAEMASLSQRFVDEYPAFIKLQLAPGGTRDDVARLLLIMQFTVVTGHEFSHLARQHMADTKRELGTFQAQEFDADGYGITVDLEYFFRGGGVQLASALLGPLTIKALQSSTLSCFLLALMIQFCARWAGKPKVKSTLGDEHPPHALRLEMAMLFVDKWCREAAKINNSWLYDGTLDTYFQAGERLFAPEQKANWMEQSRWMRSSEGESYRTEIRRIFERIRTS